MDSNQISYIVALLFAVAILVILIVILAKYKGGPADEVDAHNVNVKVNWLYWINIVTVGLVVVFGLLSLFAYRKYCVMGNCMKA
jgi:formate-dependent nitrite reductase membrane component NrfD